VKCYHYDILIFRGSCKLWDSGCIPGFIR